ncbi:MAG: trigger factor [Clostridiaceae bacterium]|jgi:trigger factor|nr:trigger factor [Clostridiaceae bacterium]
MPSQFEEKENRVAYLNIEVPAEEFKSSLEKAYQKSKRYFQVPGFRKGKAPYQIVVNHYGEGILYDDAIEYAFPAAYENALKEHDLRPYSEPRLNLVSISGADGLVLEARFALKPEVKLGEYEGIVAYRPNVEVSEEEIDAKIKEAQDKVARQLPVTDRTLEKGDTVTIDYIGKKDDIAFEGGTAEDFDLKLGSNTFIPGFEDGIVGKNVGDEFDLTLNFPEEYHADDLAGEEVVFSVVVKAATFTQVPEIDDDFVKDVSESSDTVEEYRAEIRQELEKAAAEQADRLYERNIVEQIAENSEIIMSDFMVEDDVEREIQHQSQQFEMYGLRYEDFLSYSGQTLASVRQQMLPNSRKNLDLAYTLDALDEKLALEVTDEEVEAMIVELAERSEISVEDYKESYLEANEDSRDRLEHQVRSEKLLDLLREWSVATDVDPHAHDHEHVHDEHCDHDHDDEADEEE